MTLLMEEPGTTRAEARREGGAPIVQYLRELRCPRCDAAIAGEMSISEQVRTDRGPIQYVRIYCPHCQAGFAASYVDQGGYLAQEGRTTLLMGESLAEIRRHVASIRGDLEASGLPPQTSAAAAAIQVQRDYLDEQIDAARQYLARLRHARAKIALPDARPLSADDLAQLERMDGDCDTSAAAAEAAGLGVPVPLKPPGPAPAEPEVTVDPSTDQRTEWSER